MKMTLEWLVPKYMNKWYHTLFLENVFKIKFFDYGQGFRTLHGHNLELSHFFSSHTWITYKIYSRTAKSG